MNADFINPDQFHINPQLVETADRQWFKLEVQFRSELDSKYRRDLRRMWDHSQDLLTELSRELVNCRRLNHWTRQYQELEAELILQQRTIDKYLTLALLSQNH
mgnify:CR=1 FL=1